MMEVPSMPAPHAQPGLYLQYPPDLPPTLLQCPICLEVMKLPKFLPCGHTACAKCLNKELGLHGTLRCPVDRKIVQLGTEGINGLPTNFALVHSIQEKEDSDPETDMVRNDTNEAPPAEPENKKEDCVKTCEKVLAELGTLKENHSQQISDVHNMIDTDVAEVMNKVQLMKERVDITSKIYEDTLDDKITKCKDAMDQVAECSETDTEFDDLVKQIKQMEHEEFDKMDMTYEPQSPGQVGTVKVKLHRPGQQPAEPEAPPKPVNDASQGENARAQSSKNSGACGGLSDPCMVPEVTIPDTKRPRMQRFLNMLGFQPKPSVDKYVILSPPLPEEQLFHNGYVTSNDIGLPREPKGVNRIWQVGGVASCALVGLPSGQLVMFSLELGRLCMYSLAQAMCVVSSHPMERAPAGLAYHKNLHYLLVTDGTNRVTVMSAADLRYIKTFSIEGVQQCFSIAAMDSGNLIISATQGDMKMICVCDVDGHILRTIDEGPYTIKDIRAISDYIITSYYDIRGFRIRDLTGRDLRLVEKGLGFKCGVDVDVHGNVWVADKAREKLFVYSLGGQLIYKTSLDCWPERLTITPQGWMALTNCHSSDVFVYEVN